MVDASIPYLGIGLVREFVEIEVKDVLIIGIQGDREAEILKKDLESQRDPNGFNIAKLYVDLNPKYKSDWNNVVRRRLD